jgi:Heterokaryon incompatibility protein (HET)
MQLNDFIVLWSSYVNSVSLQERTFNKRKWKIIKQDMISRGIIHEDKHTVIGKTGTLHLTHLNYSKLHCISHSAYATESKLQEAMILLKRHIDELDNDHYIWFDWISVPFDEQSERLVIANMGDIYANAKSVIVWEGHLWSRALFDNPQQKWESRTWTLQEKHLNAVIMT